MFRTKKTMQQRWDDEIASYRDRAGDELRTAARWDAVTSSRVGKWLHRFPVTDLATNHRATAVDYRATATRMENCPHNPRNGGAGWKPAPGFWDVFTVRDVAGAGLWLAINLTVGITVMLGVVYVIVGRGHYLPADSPESLLVPLKAAAAGLWAVVVTTWAMNAVLDATALATRYVRSAAK
jgi:hypothetical protein